MRVKISEKKIFLMWLIVFIIGGGLVFLAFFNLFLSKWEFAQPIIISIYSGIMIAILIISIRTQYYEINKRDLTEAKFGKKYTYFFSDIIYIDEKQSEKTKTLCFILKDGHVKYLTFDKDGKIFEAAKAKCHDLKTLEEVKRLFPSVKI